MGRLNLSAQQICDKQFNSDFKGYNPTEVDSFLDLILEDYDTFESALRDCKAEIDKLKADNSRLASQIIELEGKARANDNGGSTNQIDVLKRLSRLEEIVYKNNQN